MFCSPRRFKPSTLVHPACLTDPCPLPCPPPHTHTPLDARPHLDLTVVVAAGAGVVVGVVLCCCCWWIMLSVVDGVAVVDVVVVAIADVVAGGVADVVLLMLMFILLMSLSLMLAFLCWCWWVDVFVVVAVDDGVLLPLRAVVHVVFLDCNVLVCFCRVEARRGEQELHGTPGERAGAAFCPGGGAGGFLKTFQAF